jgi:hypothetical protein
VTKTDQAHGEQLRNGLCYTFRVRTILAAFQSLTLNENHQSADEDWNLYPTATL